MAELQLVMLLMESI